MQRLIHRQRAKRKGADRVGGEEGRGEEKGDKRQRGGGGDKGTYGAKEGKESRRPV